MIKEEKLGNLALAIKLFFFVWYWYILDIYIYSTVTIKTASQRTSNAWTTMLKWSLEFFSYPYAERKMNFFLLSLSKFVSVGHSKYWKIFPLKFRKFQYIFWNSRREAIPSE